MAIQLNDNILVARTLPIDSRYGPYTSLAVARASLPKFSGVDVTRFIGLTVGIIENAKIVEYWFKAGTADTDLVLKLPAASNSVGAALGTASAGLSAEYARADHVHPLPNGLGGDSLFSTDLPNETMSQSIGGAPAQTVATWETRSVNQILGDILFPTVLPTYTVPTLTLSFAPALASVYEVGQSLSTVVTLSAVKNDAGDFSGSFSIARSGESGSSSHASAPVQGSAPDVSSQFTYPNPNNPNKSWVKTWAQNLSLAFGTTSWIGTATQGYAAGAAKKNNKGIDDTRSPALRSANAPQTSSETFSSATVNANAIYPWFWGKSSSLPTKASIATAIASGTTNRNLATANGTLGITFAATNEFIWFALPTGASTKTKWYVNETNQGSIEATGLFALAGTTQAVNAPLFSPETVRRWNGVQYQIYISNFATTTSGAMQIRET